MAGQIRWIIACTVVGMRPFVTTPLARAVIGCAIEVHVALGPGLLESAYSHCLCREFDVRGIRFKKQVPLPVVYKNAHLDCGYRLDFIVEGELLLELKTVEHVLPIHHAQVITYLKLFGGGQALLVNFNTRRLVDGLKSFLL